MWHRNPLFTACAALVALVVFAAIIFKEVKPGRLACTETVAFVEDPDAHAAPAPISTNGPFDDPVATRPEELPMMGCLPDAPPLSDAEVEGASQAVSIAADPNSIGAVFRFQTVGQRQHLIATWLRRSAGQPNYDAEPDSDGAIGEWVNRMWRLPNGTVANVMYRERASSGDLCVVHANMRVMKSSLAALNNWCIDRLGWLRTS